MSHRWRGWYQEHWLSRGKQTATLLHFGCPTFRLSPSKCFTRYACISIGFKVHLLTFLPSVHWFHHRAAWWHANEIPSGLKWARSHAPGIFLFAPSINVYEPSNCSYSELKLPYACHKCIFFFSTDPFLFGQTLSLNLGCISAAEEGQVDIVILMSNFCEYMKHYMNSLKP